MCTSSGVYSAPCGQIFINHTGGTSRLYVVTVARFGTAMLQALLRRRLQQEGEQDKPSRLRGWKPRAHGYTTTIAMGLIAPLAVVVSRNFRVGAPS